MSERTIDDILSEFANASVECELGMSRREQIMRADECRAELNERFAAARRECEAVTQRAIRAEADLATSRAALAGVRERVEKLGRYDPIVDCNEPYMEHTERGDYFSCADVLAALGGDA